MLHGTVRGQRLEALGHLFRLAPDVREAWSNTRKRFQAERKTCAGLPFGAAHGQARWVGQER